MIGATGQCKSLNKPLKERPMPHSRNKRSFRVAAGVAVLTLPLGLALPVVADDTPESSSTVESSATAEPTQTAPSPPEQTPTPVEESATPVPQTPARGDESPADAVPSPEPTSEMEIFGDNSHAVFGFDADTNPQLQLEGSPKLETFSISAGTNNKLYLNDQWTGKANIEFEWGESNNEVLVGDWNGDGIDSAAVRKGNRFAFADRNPASAAPQFTLAYGTPGDTVLVGDWDGDGKDTLAVRRGNQYVIRNSMSGGEADKVIAYGKPEDMVLVGDWDGDGKDTFAVRRGNQYFIRNSMSGGEADKVIAYGKPEDTGVVGDWDGDGKDTFAVRRDNMYHVRNSLTSGVADKTLAYGRSGDATIVGDWNGDQADTLGVVREVAAGASENPAPPMGSNGTGSDVLAFARQYAGAPYSWGGVTPSGWDCIGLIRYVYSNYGVNIGGYPADVLAAGRQIPFSQAQPGDILYWSKDNAVANSAHVALYVDSTTNFGSWNLSMGKREGKHSWVGGTPVVIRIFG